MTNKYLQYDKYYVTGTYNTKVKTISLALAIIL